MKTNPLVPTPALYRKWKIERDRARREGDSIRLREYERKLLDSHLQEVEMSDGQITFMEVGE